ncbi:protein translocase subunit SecDF [Metamycoplasma neophronis]|uniref:Peptide transporter n=1 Tax=Metamycoplasma neophronis TaxID=872983 RepID=A0ABY2Z009_9BACT|nr:peptide transporter [Metamycoplasma neophronis]TPR54086.1 peptide transporter [Metamycoplasma neophronis]
MKKAKFFSNKFRWFINIFLIIAMILIVVFGGVFYLKPKLKNQTNSNVVTTNVGLKIKKTPDVYGRTNQNISSNELLSLTKNYIQNKDGILTSSYDINLASDEFLTVSSYQDKTEAEKKALVSSLVEKPYLTITDEFGNPLFYKGQYISRFRHSPALDKNLKTFETEGPQDYYISLDKNPALSKNKQGASHRVEVKLTDEGWNSFILMQSEYNFRYNMAMNGGQDPHLSPSTKVYFWLNLDKFIKIAKENFPEQWKAAKENPVNFAYVNNSVNPEEIKDKDGKVISRKEPVLKFNEINARKYLISVAFPGSLLSPLKSESSFYIFNNNEHGPTDKEVASAINYSYAPFQLSNDYSYFVTTNVKARNKYLIVIAALFAMFAVFLIIKYRLFGLVSALTLALFTFVFMAIVTAFNIYINPIVAFVLIIACFFAFDLMHNQLDIFKKETLDGANANKSINKATKNGLISGLDVSFGMLVIAILGIYINVSYLNTLSIIMFISIFVSLIIAMLINTWLLRSLVKTEAFDKTSKALVWNNTHLNKLSLKMNLISKSKFFTIGFALFIVLGLIVFGIFAGINKSALAGLNLSPQLTKSTFYYLTPETTVAFNGWTLDNANSVAAEITKNISNAKVEVVLNNASNNTYGIVVTSSSNISDFINGDLNTFAKNLVSNESTQLVVSSEQLNVVNSERNIGLVVAILAASMGFVSIYILIRFSLITMFVTLLKEIFAIIMVIVFMMIFHTEFNNGIFGGLVLLTMFNIIDSLINANRVKEEFKKDLNTKNYIYPDDRVKEIFILHIREIFARQMFNFIYAIIAMILCATLMKTLNTTLILTFGFGVISIVLVNLFLMPNIWMRLYMISFHRKQKRIENGYWNTEKIQEQTFIGINDFSM